MPEVNLAAIANTVIWSAFAITFVWGMVLQKTHFCTMGAVSDILNMGDWNRLRMWALAIGVAIVGTQLMAWAGLIDTAKTVYTTPKLTWLSALVGGGLFGFGMVLASGCGTKTLVRVGGGNLKALFVFVVLGVSSLMAMKGLFAVARVNSIDLVALEFATPQDLPSLLAATLGMSKATLQLLCGVGVGGALILFAVLRREFWTLDNLLGGFATGLAVLAMWFVSGKLGYLAEDPNTLQEAFIATNSGRMESLSFVAPYGYTLDLLMFWSDKSKVVTLGIASVMGVIAGAFVWALVTKSFRWEGFGSVEDTANHFVGAVLMGVGGVTALGCTIGQGLSGVSTLAVGSFLALAGILAGAVAALKYQLWRLERMV